MDLDARVRLGRTGLWVSRLCPGTMTYGLQCDEPASVAILDRWLGPRRHDLVIATKCFGAMSARPWNRGSSRKNILDAGTPLDETLRALDNIMRTGKAPYGA